MATLTQLPDDVDLAFVAGDTFRMRVRVIDPATTNPLPLSSYRFCAEVAQADRKVVTQFVITQDPEDLAHSVILTLPPSETAVLPNMGNGAEFRGLWDLEVRFPNNDVRTVAKGSVTCVIDVSNCESGPPAVAANAGNPGTWSPGDAVPPDSVADLQSGIPSVVVANPITGWPIGTFVQTLTVGSYGQARWSGTQWVHAQPDGAVAGDPGEWTPVGSNPPVSVAGLQAAVPQIVPDPTRTWVTGEYVQTAVTGHKGIAKWNGTAWVAGAATGAVSGAPGSWTPAESEPPVSVAALQAESVVAAPSDPWATGEYVQTKTAGLAGQAYWNGTSWVAGRAP
jgi:hypothetical protein